MNIWKMALRNIGRNQRRTSITTLAMSFAAAMMIFTVALSDGFVVSMEQNALGLDLGDVQLSAVGYRDDPDLYTTIENPDALLAKLEAEHFRASPRVMGGGLAAADRASAGVVLRGVDLVCEPRVTNLHNHIAQGQWLAEDKPHEVVIGKRLASLLRVGIGSEMVVLSQASDGSMANELYRVRGILGAVNEGVDRSGVLMTAASFRALMLLPQGAHIIAVRRPDPHAPLAPDLARLQAIATAEDVTSWRELQPILASLIENSKISVAMMILMAYAAISMVVLNAMLMSVFERIREFGVMKAIGVSGWQVLGIILAEGMLQAILASVLGVFLGLPLAYYAQEHGIHMAAFAGDIAFGGLTLDPVWNSHITSNALVSPIVFLLVITFVSVIYPASKAGLLNPVEALRHR